MRLVNTSTLKLESFISPWKDRTWRYAILSHTWGAEEVVFEDMQAVLSEATTDIPAWHAKKGASKIIDSCAQARLDKLEYIWIDTCCIDKSSSAELSEAINSMFTWYRRAHVCYAYLSDLRWHRHPGQANTSDYVTPLQHCRWFSRGWTLQELIAPRQMTFFDYEWQVVGDRLALASDLATITGVDEFLLSYPPRTMDEEPFLDDRLRSVSIARRMSWAGPRRTTREEDVAYSLMGIFNVNMPLLYGEGGIKAMARLQEAIIRQSGDQSILVHGGEHTLAEYPHDFSSDIMQMARPGRSAMDFAEGGLVLDVLLCPPVEHHGESGCSEELLAILNCVHEDFISRPSLLLEADGEGSSRRFRKARWPQKLYLVGPDGCRPLEQGQASHNDLSGT
jgi:hypothetical protein